MTYTKCFLRDPQGVRQATDKTADLVLQNCARQEVGNVPASLERLVYQAPDPSRATRRISRRSKASLRGFMIAMLPGFKRPRVLQFESNLEYLFLCLMLVRNDVFSIWDQPPKVSYIDRSGKTVDHTFDFLVTLSNGESIAVAIKPSARVIQRAFISELELIAAAVPKHFADRVILVTEQHLDRKAAVVAARHLANSRVSLTEVMS